jgi:hypothetical protein
MFGIVMCRAASTHDDADGSCNRWRYPMAIALDEVLDMAQRYHVVASAPGDLDEVADFFTHPEGVGVHVLHGDDLTIAGVVEALKGFTDHRFIPMEPWTLAQLCDVPEKARVVGAIYWKAHPVGSPDEVMEAIVGEDWIVERGADGKVRFALYMNTYHHLLPGSAPTGLYAEE